jgi:DNA-binding HxlR family transcriptional regulator
VDIIANKWSPIVIFVLSGQVLRHSELQRRIPGVSRKMLTQTLRRLEVDGLLERKVYPVVPPRVEYSLTPLGRKFHQAVDALHHWAVGHVEELRTVHSRRRRARP